MQFPHLRNPSFPNVCIHQDAGKTFIEVHLIADLGRGRGNAMVQQAAGLQRQHSRFVDALDEPSTCIGELKQSDTDHSSIYTFLVESQGHPFHRHASARIFTAVSGGDGTELRFSTATFDQHEFSGDTFFERAHCIQIPADCLFTVRFAAGVWHQFVPSKANSASPALFAVSCHPDDLHGVEDVNLRNHILGGKASIPMLTEVLPVQLVDAIGEEDFATRCATFQRLQFHQSYASLVSGKLVTVASKMKASYQKMFRRFHQQAISSASKEFSSLFARTRQQPVPQHSLIWNQLSEKKSYHLDHFELLIPSEELLSFRPHEATGYMRDLLQAFTDHSPLGVTRLMQLRNAIVKPFGLRTSSVGCPVSSLLADQAQDYFLQRFPIWEQHMNADNTEVQVVLGADDKHLQFRSVVMVEIIEEGIVISLSNRVAYRNFFGRFYMTCIRGIHQAYIVPKMLSTAASQLCSLESTVERHQCRCMRLLLGA